MSEFKNGWWFPDSKIIEGSTVLNEPYSSKAAANAAESFAAMEKAKRVIEKYIDGDIINEDITITININCKEFILHKNNIKVSEICLVD